VESSPKAKAVFVKCRKWNWKFMKRVVYVTVSAVQTQRTKTILTVMRSPASICICKEYSLFFRKYAIDYAIGDRLQRPHYLSRVDHERKIRSRRQRTDIVKYSFVNRTIQDWNQLPAEVLGTLPCKPNTMKNRVRKEITEVS
jgi:hypothetical protein